MVNEQDVVVQDAPEVRPQEYAELQIVNQGQAGVEQVVEEPAPSYQRELQSKDTKEDWEHKYNVLKGKYDKEVKRLHRELDVLRRENSELRAKVDTLMMMLASQRADVREQAESSVDDELKKFKEDYPELYNAVRKMVENYVGRVREEVKATSEGMSEKQYLATLTALVPNWQEINTDPEFLDWLKERDELSGYTRHELMLMAHEKRDAYRVAQFFKRFLAETGRGGEVVGRSNRVSVSPQSRRVANAGDRVQRVYKESEIKNFYRDLALGKIPPDVASKWEKEYTQAVIEGRVIYGK